MRANGSVNLRRNIYDVSLDMSDFNWTLDSDVLFTKAASARFVTTDSTVTAGFSDEGTQLDFNAACNLNTLIKRFDRCYKIAMEQYAKHSLNVDTLQVTMPKFNMKLQMGSDGIVQRYLDKYDVDFRKVNMDVRNDSNIFIDGFVHSLSVGSTAIDTITLHASEVKNRIWLSMPTWATVPHHGRICLGNHARRHSRTGARHAGGAGKHKA